MKVVQAASLHFVLYLPENSLIYSLLFSTCSYAWWLKQMSTLCYNQDNWFNQWIVEYLRLMNYFFTVACSKHLNNDHFSVNAIKFISPCLTNCSSNIKWGSILITIIPLRFIYDTLLKCCNTQKLVVVYEWCTMISTVNVHSFLVIFSVCSFLEHLFSIYNICTHV